MSCYKKKIINYKNGVLDTFVDVTYVITMENNIERHKKVMEQLEKYKPTKKIIIIYNKGFKKCEKKICYDKNKKCQKVNISYEDLSHANNYIYSDALKNQYNNILLLEDDFIMSEKIKDKKL